MLEGQEWEDKKEDIVIRKDGIHTHQQVCDFMAQEHSIREPYDNVQYRIFCIPDFQEDKSCIIFKVHHV